MTPARTGVQVYDGVREYRPADEVFAKASLDSYRGATVTLGHPGKVSPESWGRDAIGVVLDVDPEPFLEDGEHWVQVHAGIYRADGMSDVQSRKREHVSMGYTCDLDPTPGVTPDGQKYDCVQRNIRINHLAMLDTNEGPRAGKGARVRADATEKPPMKVKLDGIEYEVGSEAHLSALQVQADRANERADAAEARAQAVAEERDRVTAERDAAKERADSVTADKSDAAVEKAASELLEFRSGAKRVLGADYKFDGKSRHQVRLDALAKLKAEPKGDSESYVEAYYQSRLDALPEDFDHNTVESKETPKEDGVEDFEKQLAEKRAAAAKAGGLV